jgi:hypothetical protein
MGIARKPSLLETKRLEAAKLHLDESAKHYRAVFEEIIPVGCTFTIDNFSRSFSDHGCNLSGELLSHHPWDNQIRFRNIRTGKTRRLDYAVLIKAIEQGFLEVDKGL